MRKKFDLGKIDFNGTGRKINSVVVDVELKDTKNGPVFTASAMVWNKNRTDCWAGGQCLDELASYFTCNDVFKKIYRFWQLYHLNDMHAGTVAQEDALIKASLTKFATDYDDCCRYLDSIGLLVDNGYKFGTGWLYRSIPEDDLNKIKELLK